MTSEDMTSDDVAVEHVLTFTATTGAPAMIPGAPRGTRGVIVVTGGEFQGPRLSGTVAAGGGDWFRVRPSGSLEVDARILLVCSDGTNILLTYSGIAMRTDAGMDIRVAVTFEAPEGPHAWLNEVQGVGRGAVVDGGVRYELFALR